MDANVKRILTQLGWKIIDVTPHKTSDKLCDICEEKIQSHVAVFTCGHISCTMCVDNLADSYQGEDVLVLFRCPKCLWDIKNITYE
jgi:hypothetical protein